MDVLDYLVKPITFERFFKAASKAKDFHELSRKAETSSNEKIFNYFFVKCDNRLEKIFFDDVLYIEGMSNYVIIYTRQKKLISYMTLKGLEENLPSNEFLQIHKSYIISISKIDNLNVNEVNIAGKSLPISRNYKDVVMNSISDRVFKR